MSSPYVVHSRLCTEKQCEPFFIREWETVLLATLIAATLLYITYSCNSEYFSGYAQNAATQRFMSVDDRESHEVDKFHAGHAPRVLASVHPGLSIPLSGVSTEMFTEFAKVDMIDDMDSVEDPPSHQPETSDEELALINTY